MTAGMTYRRRAVASAALEAAVAVATPDTAVLEVEEVGDGRAA
jgi:hypothetical protein